MRGNSTDHAELERIWCVPCAVCRVDVVYPLVPSLRNPLSGFTHSGAARCSPQQGPRCVEHTPASLVVHLQAFKAGLCLAATCRHHSGEDACGMHGKFPTGETLGEASMGVDGVLWADALGHHSSLLCHTTAGVRLAPSVST